MRSTGVAYESLAVKFGLYVVHGNVSAGKGTLSKALLRVLPGAVHYCSDDIRVELSGDIGGPSSGVASDGTHFDVFSTLDGRVNAARAAGKTVIADSTGMSAAFVASVNAWRKEWNDVVVIRVFCDDAAWKRREEARQDRWTVRDGERVQSSMPDRVYYASLDSRFAEPADVEIDTSALSPAQVFDAVIAQCEAIWAKRRQGE